MHISHLKAKMQQIRFRPGLCPRPLWGREFRAIHSWPTTGWPKKIKNHHDIVSKIVYDARFFISFDYKM